MTTNTRTFFLLLAALLVAGLTGAHAQGWQWAHQAGTTGYDRGQAICADAAGNTYVTGYFKETLTLGGNTYASNGEQDLFLVKYDPTGDVVWVKTAGGSQMDQGTALTFDLAGNIVLAGSFQHTMVLDTTTLTSAGASDIFLARYSTDGDLLWATRDGGDMWDYADALAADANGNLFVAGSFQQNTTLGGQTFFANPSSVNMFVARVNPQGALDWVKPMIMTNMYHTSKPTGLTTDPGGNVVVSGYITGAGNLDGTYFVGHNLLGGGGAIFYTSMWLAKFDNAGNLSWITEPQTTGSSYNTGGEVVTDALGNIYQASFFSGSAAFGSTQLTSTSADFDALLVKYDPAGTPVWAVKAGGTGNDRATELAIHPGGQLYMAGSFTNTLTIGSSTLTAVANTDVFIASYDLNGNAQNALAGGSAGHEAASGIALGQNNVYITGMTDGPIAFGPHTGTAQGLEDFFVASMGFISATPEANTLTLLTPAYPNPFQESVTLQLPTAAPAHVSLHDALGRQVWAATGTPVENGQLRLAPGSDLPKGLYLLKITQDHAAAMVRLVKH